MFFFCLDSKEKTYYKCVTYKEKTDYCTDPRNLEMVGQLPICLTFIMDGTPNLGEKCVKEIHPELAFVFVLRAKRFGIFLCFARFQKTIH